MRVMQLIPSLVGGAERMVATLAQRLRLAGHTIAVVSLYDLPGTWIEAELGSEDVPLRFLGNRRRIDLRMVVRLARVFHAFRPDVLHTHHALAEARAPGAGAASVHPRDSHRAHAIHRGAGSLEHGRAVDRLQGGGRFGRDQRGGRGQPPRGIRTAIPLHQPEWDLGVRLRRSAGAREAVRASHGISPAASMARNCERPYAGIA